MNIVIVLVLAAIVFFVIYILSAREQKKMNEKFATRGKVEEYCAGEKNRRKSGISILVYEILPKDSLIDMEISIPNSKEIIKLRGKVAWCEGCNGQERRDKDGKRTFIVGIELVDTEKKYQEALTEYIHKHLSNNK